MTLKGKFPFFISYIVSCFAVEFHGKKEECVLGFISFCFLNFFQFCEKVKNSNVVKESPVRCHGHCNYCF